MYDGMVDALADKTGSIPVDRIGDPMETDDLVAYLSSPRSGFVNGRANIVDGGSMDSML